MNNITKLGIFFIIVILGFGFLAFYWTFYKPLPDYSKTLELDGLNESVEIYWDEYGVPHIYASNEDDLYYAVGYVHAQDRLWQMTLSQIAAEGRFAEFFGEELIDFDRYQRTLGYWRMAKQLKDSVLSAEELQRLESYSAGVNLFIDDNSNRLPVEFALTQIEPIRWSPERSLALTRMLGWELNMSWWTETLYNHLLVKLGPDKLEELRLRFPEDAPTTMDDQQSLDLSSSLMPMLEMEMDLRKALNREGSHVGSNAWVVDGSKTRTGYPLLAGDPHLGLDMPGKWYEVHMSLNGKNVSGATLAGIPVVVIGQNDYMAWSMTNIMSDDTDFFLERPDPNDRSRYVVDSVGTDSAIYESFEVIKENIKVKDGGERVHEIRFTKHGPVISDIYPRQQLINDQIISLQWTGYEYSNELRTLYEINWADNFQEFKDALPHLAVPGQNILYGDVSGNIAMFSTGWIPIRNGDPITFRRGWVPEDDWQGYVPTEKMPQVINPEKGWIANANNKLYTDNYPYYLATFWEPPSRIERIISVLAKDTVFTPEDFAKLQNDTYSTFAAKMTPIILDIIRNQQTYNFDEAVTYLENWDYRYEENATAASIFDAIFLNITKNTLMDEFGEENFEAFLTHENVPVRTLSTFLNGNSTFFDDITTETIETKEDIVLESIRDAIYFLSDSLGQEAFQWRWEQLHTITFKPPLFSEAAESEDAPAAVKLIVNNLLLKGPYPVVGHGMSVNNGQYNWADPYEMVLGPSIRRIVDFSDLSKVRTIISTGQSGNPLSEHYGDQINFWLNGQYRFLYQDSSLFQNVDYRKMTLNPEN